MRERFFQWARRWDHGLLPFMGPAQLGAGHPEQPYQLPAQPTCPVCGKSMAEHEIQRAAEGNWTTPTRIICPA